MNLKINRKHQDREQGKIISSSWYAGIVQQQMAIIWEDFKNSFFTSSIFYSKVKFVNYLIFSRIDTLIDKYLF
ncbi:hypothetical protein Avbf_01452 [Armadillidium vulgare]|nr:hypothetical protein Avbf_01452 [Armadillidium vulgare]